jgi:hypothetical protein
MQSRHYDDIFCEFFMEVLHATQQSEAIYIYKYIYIICMHNIYILTYNESTAAIHIMIIEIEIKLTGCSLDESVRTAGLKFSLPLLLLLS